MMNVGFMMIIKIMIILMISKLVSNGDVKYDNDLFENMKP